MNGQDDQCEKPDCIPRNTNSRGFNCSISTWAPASGELCIQAHERLRNPECTHVTVDKSGIVAEISEDKKFIRIEVFAPYCITENFTTRKISPILPCALLVNFFFFALC